MHIEHLTFGVYGYFEPIENGKNLKCLYVGSDSNIIRNRRDIEHRSKAHADRQEINKRLNDSDQEDLIYMVLGLFATKESMLAEETRMINQHKPTYNVKRRHGEDEWSNNQEPQPEPKQQTLY